MAEAVAAARTEDSCWLEAGGNHHHHLDGEVDGEVIVRYCCRSREAGGPVADDESDWGAVSAQRDAVVGEVAAADGQQVAVGKSRTANNRLPALERSWRFEAWRKRRRRADKRTNKQSLNVASLEIWWASREMDVAEAASFAHRKLPPAAP